MSMPQPSSSSWLSCCDSCAAQWKDMLILLARICFGLLFVIYAWPKLFNVAGYAATMPRRGLPEFLGYVAPFVEFFGGLFVVFGIAVRYSALVMLLFLIIATFSSHRYWSVEPSQYAAQMGNFWKNISIMSGSILLFVVGGGRFAVDALLGRRP